MSCVAPNCKSGYGTKNVYPPGVGKHRFPTDPVLRKQWIAAIPRSSWEPSDHSRICSLHFDPSDYTKEHHDSNKHRKKNTALKKKRLKSDAVPRYFPGCPSYLSTKPPIRRSETATSAFRQNRIAKLTEQQSKNFLDADKVIDFKSLLSSLPEEFPSSWNAIILKKEDKLIIEDVDFDEDGKPVFRYSIAISSTLEFALFSNDCSVSPDRVKHILKSEKIERHSDVLNILAFLNCYSVQTPTLSDTVKDCTSKLSKVLKQTVEPEDSLTQKLEFIVEQLSLAVSPVQSRKYSSKLLWKCLSWQKTSPALYKLILSEGQLSLPSVSRLHRLGSAYHLETGSLFSDSIH